MSQGQPVSTEREIFVAAAKIENAGDREAFLSKACGGSDELKERVDRLLAARSTHANGLLQRAVDGIAPKLDSQSVNNATELTEFQSDAIKIGKIDVRRHPMIDRYKLLEEIGHGGMGTVYMADQTAPVKRRVAVKLINPGMDSRDVLARFEAERQALALMNHPNIARVFDGGTTESGRPYFVMELVRGVPLNKFCSNNNLSLSDRLELFCDVCHAVQHAHQKGIIHRDLKPSNILVSVHDDRPVVKVIDFGVAKALDQDLTDKTLFTQFSAMIGTPIYMSPEQAKMSGLDVDTRSDIYSLGVILYELVTGTTPFDRMTLSKVGINKFRELIIEEVPQRPSSRVSTVRAADASTVQAQRRHAIAPPSEAIDRELDWIVMKALAKDREQRYESSTALADDVGRFLRGETVLACPPTASYRMRKWIRRNRYAVAAGGLALSVLAFVAAVSLWQVRQVSKAWQESRIRERQAIDLLDAGQLQSAVGAFHQSGYQAIPELLRLPMASLDLSGRDEFDRSYFRRLLLDAARPDNDETVHVAAALSDLAWDHANQCVWAIDSIGNIYRSDKWPNAHARSSLPSTAPVGVVGKATNSLAVSPDGASLAVGTTDGEISLWSVGDSIVERRRIQVGENGVETIVWSADGAYLAAGSRYEGFWVGHPNGDTLFQFPNDHRHESLVFLPNGRELLVPTREGIDVYSLPDGVKTRTIDTGGHENPRELILAGPEKRWLLVGERFSESLLVIDSQTGQRLGSIALLSRYPQSLALWEDGRKIAVLLPSGMLQILRLDGNLDRGVTARPIYSFSIVQVEESIESNARLRVVVSPQGNELVTAGPSDQIRRWNLDRILPIQVFIPPSPVKAVYPIARDELAYFYHPGDSAQDSKGVRAYPIGIGKPSTQEVGEPMPSSVSHFSRHVSRHGWIACAGPGQVVIYDVVTGKIIGAIETSVENVLRVEISPSGNAVALASSFDDEVIAWRTSDAWKTNEQVLSTDSDVMGVFCFAERDDETFLLWDNYADRVHELGIRSGAHRIITERKGEWFTSSAVSSHGRLLAIGHRDDVEIIDLESRKSRFRFGELSAVHSLAFLPGDRILLSGHEDGHVEAWHLPTGQSLGTLIDKAGIGIPESIVIHPDCYRLLISFQTDEEVRKVTPVIVGSDRPFRSLSNRRQ